MKLKKYIKKIMAVGGCALLGATMLAGCADVKMTQDDYDTEITNAKAEGKASVDITTDNAGVIATAVAAVDITTDNEKAGEDAIAAMTKDQVPDAIQEQILKDAADAQDKVDADTEAKGYTLDDLQIGAEVNEILSDREIGIFDGEVEFDGDDYDAEEVLYLNKLRIAANEEEDMGSDTFLQLPEKGIRYALEFATNLNMSLIGTEDYEDETLIFDFLGEEVEVSDWSNDEITFTRGEEFEFIEGQEQTIDDRKVKVSIIHVVDDTGYVKVYVDGVGRKIYEGSTRTVNGIEIKVTEVSVNDETDDEALLEIGEEVEITVGTGDEYEDDSIWDYVVDKETNTLGLELNEKFMDIEDDEEFKALAAGEEICLPNNYICVTYDGLVEEDTEKYSFEMEDDLFVEVKGNFINGVDDYDTIYIDKNGIYDDEDPEDRELDVASIELGDTGLTLDLVKTYDEDVLIATNIEIGDIKTDLILGLLEANGEYDIGDLSEEDEDYITDYGIIIETPEDNLEDNEIEIIIPEEELKAKITVTSK